MGNLGRGRLGKDANPDDDRTNNGFVRLCRFFISASFILKWFVSLNHLKTNNVNCCKADLEIPVSRFYNTMNT